MKSKPSTSKYWIAMGTALLAIVITLIYVFRSEINDWLGCMAYYDQCTADKIEGLSKEECFDREDNVAYLLDNGICLVKPK